MALATNSTPGSIVLAGDLTGTANTPELRVTGVTPGSYTAPDIVVDSKGRVLSATESTTAFLGDMIGTRSATALKASGVTAGSYTNASPTINSQGLVTGVTGSGTTFNGMLTGAIGSNVLAPTGVTPGTYNYVGITVDSTGRVMSVNQQPTGYNISSYSVNGIVQIDQNLGLTVSSGNLSGTMATGSVFGVIKTADSSNINITTGTVNVGSNIPKLIENNTFGRATVAPIPTAYATNFSPDVDSGDIIAVAPHTTTTITAPTTVSNGQSFDVVVDRQISDTWSISTTSLNIRGACWNGSVFCMVCSSGVYTSVNGTTWTLQSVPYGGGDWFDVTWNGGFFCIVGDDGNRVNGRCATSPDGVNWTQQTMPQGAWSSVAWNGTVFCAVGSLYSNGRCATSPDGISWTVSGISHPYTGIAWNGTVFCAVYAGVNNEPGKSQTSTNGITWSAIVDIPEGIFDIDYNGTMLCAVGYAGYSGNVIGVSATSTDGITWGGHVIANSIYWQGIYWDGMVFRAFGAYAGTPSGNRMAIGAFSYGDVVWAPEYVFNNAHPESLSYTTHCTHFNGINYCTYQG